MMIRNPASLPTYQMMHWNIQGKGKNNKFEAIKRVVKGVNPAVISFNEPYSFSPRIDGYSTVDAQSVKVVRSKLNCSILIHESIKFNVIKTKVNYIAVEVNSSPFNKPTTIISAYLIPAENDRSARNNTTVME
jgi:hypothetical protein